MPATALRSCGFALQLLVPTSHNMHGSQLRWVRHGESPKASEHLAYIIVVLQLLVGASHNTAHITKRPFWT